MTLRDEFIGDRDLEPLEQTLIENLEVYNNLITKIKKIQPELKITTKLKENICWIIANSERIKELGFMWGYMLDWRPNMLIITWLTYDNSACITKIKLVQNRLYVNNSKNMETYILQNISGLSNSEVN